MDRKCGPMRDIRLRKGITLRALADKVGVSAAYLSDIERGNRRGSFATIAKIAAVLQVDVDILWEAE